MSDEIKSKFIRLVELRQERDEAKAAASAREEEYREYEAELWEWLNDSPFDGALKLDLGKFGKVSFSPRETYYGRILDQDKALDAFEAQARTDEMTEPKIVKARLHEYVRECLENNTDLPAGIDFYPQRYISISMPKK